MPLPQSLWQDFNKVSTGPVASSESLIGEEATFMWLLAGFSYSLGLAKVLPCSALATSIWIACGLTSFRVRKSVENTVKWSELAQSCPTLCDPVDCSWLFMGFSRQEYWSGFPFPSPGDLTNPGIESWFLTWQADALSSEPPGKSLCREHNEDINYRLFII